MHACNDPSLDMPRLRVVLNFGRIHEMRPLQAAIIYGAVAATLSSIMTMLGAPHAEYQVHSIRACAASSSLLCAAACLLSPVSTGGAAVS